MGRKVAVLSVGKRLQHARLDAGLSQFQLAVAAGVAPHTVSRIELGKQQPGTLTLRRLARALGVTVGELVDGAAA